MSRYTEQKVFAFDSQVDRRSIIPDVGESLIIEYSNLNGAFVPDDLSPITTPQVIFTRNVVMRVTPTAGGGYVIDDGGRL